MFRLICLALLAMSALRSEPAWSGDPKEQAKLQGTWSCVELFEEGNKVKDDDKRASMRMVFDGNKLTLTTKGEAPLQATFRLDPSKKPKEIDVTIENRTVLAIYELTDDTLKFCHLHGETSFVKERPKELVADEKTVFAVFKREKK